MGAAQAPATLLVPVLNASSIGAAGSASAAPSARAVSAGEPIGVPVAASAMPRADADVAGSMRPRGPRTTLRAGGFCSDWRPERFQRNPSRVELLCRHEVAGPGRFGLLSYLDLPVYQPATPMPGTHLAGVPGHAQPAAGESFEEWEWRVHRTEYPEFTRVARRTLDLLHPSAAARVMALERRLAEDGIRFVRLETWRHPDRQAFLFQQGRSRPGPIATATLTSWHGLMDEHGRPAGRAVDYSVPRAQMRHFHQIAHEVGLASYGADSHDPGHVYLPLDNPLPAAEIQMLRLLPRVPEVTLATGLPVDRRLPREGRSFLRANVSAWVSAPFVPYSIPQMAGEVRAPEPALAVMPVPEVARAEPARRGRSRNPVR